MALPVPRGSAATTKVTVSASGTGSITGVGAQAGDLVLIAVEWNRGSGTAALTTDVAGISGFYRPSAAAVATGAGIAFFWKTATASEPANYTITAGAAGAINVTATVIAYTGAEAPLLLSSGATAAAAGSVGAGPNVNNYLDANTLMVEAYAGFASGKTMGVPAAATSRAQTAGDATFGALTLADRSAGANGTQATDSSTLSSGTANLVGLAILLRPVNAAVPPTLKTQTTATATLSSGGTVAPPNPYVPGADTGILVIESFGGVGAMTITTPTGWTLQHSGGTANNPTKVYTRLLDGGANDTPTVSWTGGSGATQRATFLLANAANATNPIDTGASASAKGATSATIPAPQVSYAGVRTLLYGFIEDSSVSTTLTLPAGVTSVTSPGTTAFTNGVLSIYAYENVSGTATSTARTATLSVSEPYAAVTLALIGFYAAPLAPTLTTPANNSYADLTAGATFTASFNAGSPGDTQAAYAFRRKLSGAGAYEYWNATTAAWQSTIVWNTSTSGSVTFPAGVWTNGSVYNWSVAHQGAGGAVPTNQGPFAADSVVNASTGPTVAISAPSGVVTTSTPTVSWVPTVQAGSAQTSYRVVVESGSYGTTPGSGTTVWDSGTQVSAATSAQVATALANGGSYRVFVMVTETGGQASGWAFSTVSIAYDAPATPTLTTAWDATLARAIITVQGRENLLSLDDASFESSLGGWVAGANTTAALSTTQVLDGSSSMRLTATGAGTVSAFTPTGTNAYPVIAGTVYTALASARAATTGRVVTLTVSWWKASGAASTVRATDTGTVSDTSGAFAQAAVTATAPSDAAFASLTVSVAGAGAGEQHYIDQADIGPGSSTFWTRGGFAATSVYEVDRSTDGGATWVVVRNASGVATDSAAHQQAVVYDYEAPPGTSVTYRARALQSGGSLASPYSSSVPVTPTYGGAWLKDPLNPAVNVALSCLDNVTPTRGRGVAVLQPLGARYPIVQVDTRHARTFSVGLTPMSQAEADAVDALLSLPARVLLLQRPPAVNGWRGLSAYVVVTGDDTATPLGNVPADTATVTFPVAEVAAP